MALSTHVPVLAALEMLLSVARTGSLNSAARNAGVTQQAVSARMPRHGSADRRHAGAPYPARIQPDHRRRRNRGVGGPGYSVSRRNWTLESLRCGKTGAAGCGSAPARPLPSSSCGRGWRPSARPPRQAGLPDIVLTAANTETVIRHVTEGTVDIGFTEGPRQPASPRSRVIGHDRLVVIAAPGHPWARRRSGISAAELCSTPLVSREAAPAPGTPWPRRWPLRSVPALSRSPRRCRCLPLQRSGRRCWPARRPRSSASSPSPTT